MNDVIGGTLAVILTVLEILAIWKWGFRGVSDRLRSLFVRIVEGPTPAVKPRPDYTRIAALEAELDGER